VGYIGREPTNSGQFLLIDDISGEFNGSKSSFTLKIGGIEITPAASNTIIALDGVLQEANDAYSISGSTIAFTGAPGSEFTFYGVLAGQSQYISNNSITDEHISPTADISGSKINTNFSGQTVTAKDFGGNISGSISSTGSFGRLEIAGNTNLTGDIEFDDVTATGNIITTGTNKVISGSITSTGSFGTIQTTNGTIPTLVGNTTFSDDLTVAGNLDIADTIFHTGDSNTKIRFPEVDTISFHTSGNERMRISAGGQITASGNVEVTGNISGSITSTGSFGRVNSTTIDIDSIQGNWTNAGNTVADLGVITTADINGGTIDGITSLTAGGNLDIGAHDFRARKLTADNQTSGNVAIYSTAGLLSEDSDLTFSGATLSATNVTTTGTIKDFTSLSGSAVSTGSIGRLETTSANALIGGNVVTIGGALTTAGTLTTQNNNVTINAVGAARTLTLNESLTVGDGHDGTITFGAASKTLTIENTSLVNQDLTTDASPTFAGATITGTLTVQEVHTEFESASILFTSGSTQLGNSTDDVHNVTGSMKITGSFQVDNGTLTAGTVDINGGTVDGITSLTAGGDLDIGSHGFRAATLTADGLTAGRVPFAGTAGLLSDDSDLTFATATLSATNLTTTGTIKNMALVSGSSVSTGSFGRVQTRAADIGTITGTTLSTTGGTVLGNASDDIHQVTGSLKITNNTDNTSDFLVITDEDSTAASQVPSIKFRNKTTTIGTVRASDFKGLQLGGQTNTQDLTISGSRVGIGITAPSGSLHISNTGTTVMYLEGDSDNSGQEDAYIKFLVDGQTQEALVGWDNNNSTTLFNGNTENSFAIGCRSNLPIVFATNNTERMQITAAGRVGIGDSSPGSPLDVKSGEAANTANFNSTSGATNITLESNGSLIGQMEFSGPGPSQIVTRTSASLAFGSNNVKTLYITDDDNVGIGTNSPAASLHIKNTGGTAYGHFVTIEGDTTDNNNYPGISFKAGTLANAYPEIGVSNGGLMFSMSGGYHSSNYNNRTKIEMNGSDGHIRLMTGGDPAAEKMRITSGGAVLIGDTAQTDGELFKVHGSTDAKYLIRIHQTNTAIASDDLIMQMAFDNDATTTAGARFITFEDSNTSMGSIAVASNVDQIVYNTTSDERLKENIKDASSQLKTINDIQVREFKWKRNGYEDIGVIAQELEKVYPKAVTKGGDDVSEKPYEVDYSTLVIPLIKAVQELSAKVDSQQKEIEELKK
jgi:hypothetical protein